MRISTVTFLFLLMPLSVDAALAPLAGSALRLEANSLPSTCRNGEVRADSGTSDRLKYCLSNTWYELTANSLNQTLTNKTFDADGTGNTLTNIENENIKASAGISRDKMASGTASHVLINDGSGVMSSEASLAISRGGTGQSTAQAAIDALLPAQSGNTGKVLTTDGSNAAWGSAGGGASFAKWLVNPKGANDAAGWEAYADAAGIAPVDGDGGSPTVTVTRTTTVGQFYEGESGLVCTKDAANRQGEGCKTDFTLEEGFAETSKKITLTMPYKVSTSNYVSGDFTLFVYDGTTVRPCLTDMDNNSDGNHGDVIASTTWATHQCWFYSTAGVESYTLAFHITSTNANAYALYYQITGFTEASPTPTLGRRSETLDATGSGDFTGGTFKVTKIGDLVLLEVTDSITFASNSSVASADGFLPEWARPSSNAVRNVVQLAGSYTREILVESDGQVTFLFKDWAGNATNQTASGNANFISYTAADSIGNLISSTERMYQMAEFTALTPSSQTVSSTSETKVQFDAATRDNLSGWSNSSDRYTVYQKGRYKVDASLQFSNATNSEAFYIYIYVNGSAVRRRFMYFVTGNGGVLSMDAELDLNANDYVEIFVKSTSDSSYDVILGSGNNSWFSVSRVHPNSEQGVWDDDQSGTYVPTYTATTNLDSVSGNGDATYSQKGNIVTVSAQITTDATAASDTQTLFTMSLPIPPDENFSGAGGECVGTGVSIGPTQAGRIRSEGDTKLCNFIYNAQSTSVETFSVIFQYRIR